MPRVGIQLGVALSKRLPIGRDSTIYAPLSAMTFARGTPSYLLHNGVMTGPFGNNDAAIRNINGVPFVQIERAWSTQNARSEEFSNAYWSKTNLTIGADDINDPVGLLTGDKLKENTDVNTYHYISKTGLGSFTSGNKTVCFKFARPDERDGVHFQFAGGAFPSNPTLRYNFGTELFTIASNVDWYDAQKLDNGWYLLVFGCTATATANTAYYDYIAKMDEADPVRYDGVAGSGIHQWGVNVIEGPGWLPSYIQAGSSTATRNADNVQYSSANIDAKMPWARDGFICDLYPHFSSSQIGEDHVLFEAQDSAENFILYLNSSGQVVFEGSVTGNIFSKSALTWSAYPDDPIRFDFQFNDGSNSKLIVSGATTGDGSQTGASQSYDGKLYLGSENTLTDSIDGLISVPQKR